MFAPAGNTYTLNVHAMAPKKDRMKSRSNRRPQNAQNAKMNTVNDSINVLLLRSTLSSSLWPPFNLYKMIKVLRRSVYTNNGMEVPISKVYVHRITNAKTCPYNYIC